MSGAPAAASAAYAMLRRGGLVVAAGLPDAKQTFSKRPSLPWSAMNAELRAATWEAGVPQRDLPLFLNLYRQGRLPVNRLRSATVTLDTINEGFDRLASGVAVRDVLVFDVAKR